MFVWNWRDGGTDQAQDNDHNAQRRLSTVFARRRWVPDEAEEHSVDTGAHGLGDEAERSRAAAFCWRWPAGQRLARLRSFWAAHYTMTTASTLMFVMVIFHKCAAGALMMKWAMFLPHQGCVVYLRSRSFDDSPYAIPCASPAVLAEYASGWCRWRHQRLPCRRGRPALFLWRTTPTLIFGAVTISVFELLRSYFRIYYITLTYYIPTRREHPLPAFLGVPPTQPDLLSPLLPGWMTGSPSELFQHDLSELFKGDDRKDSLSDTQLYTQLVVRPSTRCDILTGNSVG